MTPDSIKTFLRQYVASLKEETQRTSKGDRFGFDYLIEQLGRAEDWVLYRSPSHAPDTNEDLPQPKKEPEHGVDYAFLTRDRRQLIVFVLKDEKLTYANFESAKIRSDMSRASAPDLRPPELAGVTSVRVILAYNKLEDEEGVEEFDRQVQKLGTKVGDHVSLGFERWNLDRLVDEFHQKVLTPAVLPPNFFRKLTYICLQVEDFSHGSAQWEEVLIPDWREFLKLVLEDPVPRSVWMVAVALVVVQQHGKKEAAFATGWIDLLEWAMLALWDAALRSGKKEVTEAVVEIWMLSYVIHLQQFYQTHGASLAIEDSLSLSTSPSFEPVAETYLAYWHLARLGLLWHSICAVPVPEGTPEHATFVKGLNEIADWIIGLQEANPAAFRPVMDSHHIEIFLVWSVFFGVDRNEHILGLLRQLSRRLLLRRREGGPLRILSTDNTWESVFETIIEGKPLNKAYGRSSYLLLMLEEMCLGLSPIERDAVLKLIHEHIVLGVGPDGKSFEYPEEVELVSWAPPPNWEKLMLTGELLNKKDNGVAITTGNFVRYPNQKEASIAERIEDFIKQSREMYPTKRDTNLPLAVLLLACVKFRSPIPPEFWRSGIFGPLAESASPPPADTSGAAPSKP